jgi:hypothetical protein
MWQAVRWQHWLALTAIVVLAFIIRWHRLGENSLWTDEYLSMECSSGWARTDMQLAGTAQPVPDLVSLKNARPWQTIWASIAADENHPPLYFLMLRGWRVLFGDSEVALRSLSVLAGLIAIILLFAVGAVVHSPRVALWACLLMAVASPQIQQSQDARAYMPMTAVCLAAALAVVSIDRFGSSRIRCAMLFVATLIAPLLHYMAFATLAALAIYTACMIRGSVRKNILLSMAAAMATYAVLWGPQLLSQHYRVTDGTTWMITEQFHPIRTTLENLCTLPARLFVELNEQTMRACCLSVVLFILPIAPLKQQPRLWLWWIWMITPVMVALLIDLATRRQSLSMIKYTLAAAPAAYLLLAVLAAQLRHVGWLPAGVIALACTAAIPSSYESSLPNWRALALCIEQNTRPGDPVVFVDIDPHAYASECELSATYYLQGRDHPLFILNRQPTGEMLAKLRSASHVCVVGSSCDSLAWADIPGMKLDHVEFLAGMALVGTEDPVKPLALALNTP